MRLSYALERLLINTTKTWVAYEGTFDRLWVVEGKDKKGLHFANRWLYAFESTIRIQLYWLFISIKDGCFG